MPAETLTSPAPATTGSAAPPSDGEIHIIPQPIEPSAPPKPGTARSRMFNELRKKAGVAETDKPVEEAGDRERDFEKLEDDRRKLDEAPETPVGKEESKADPVAPTDKGKQKTSPWKLVDQWKERAAKAEERLVKIEQVEAQAKELEQRLTETQKRNQELEESIKFTDYTKSKEYAEKYEQPYESAWKKAMGELNEITVSDLDTGNERPVSANDMLELVNLPLGKAREIADEKFGAFADDVMAHRKEIRSLFEAKNNAVENARKNIDEHQKLTQQEHQERFQRLHNEVSTMFQKVNEEALKDERVSAILKPVEGDEEINTSLERGFKFVDTAWSMNPLDPSLSADKRAEIVKMHAAMRNRAAAFGRIRLENSRLQAKMKELSEKLKGFEGSEPPIGQQRRTPSADAATTSARQSVFGRLREMAK